MLQGSGSAASTAATSTTVVVCPVCGKQLSGRNGKQKLQYHMLTHTGEKPFQCPYCTYRAALKFNLVSHIKNIHKLPASARSFPSPPMSTSHHVPFTNSSGSNSNNNSSSFSTPVSAGSLLLMLGNHHMSGQHLQAHSSMGITSTNPPVETSVLNNTLSSPPPQSRPISTPRLSHDLDDSIDASD